MSHLTALEQARYAFDHIEATDRQARIDNVYMLDEWKIFSNHQISRFTGIDVHRVGTITGKTETTGGNLPGESLAPIIEFVKADARGEEDRTAVKRAVAAGASTRMISRLANVSQSKVMRWTADAA